MVFNELALWLLTLKTRASSYFWFYYYVASLIFLPKTLIQNKITFLTSNLLNLAELAVIELLRKISKKKLPIFLFLPDLSLVNNRPGQLRARYRSDALKSAKPRRYINFSGAHVLPCKKQKVIRSTSFQSNR